MLNLQTRHMKLTRPLTCLICLLGFLMVSAYGADSIPVIKVKKGYLDFDGRLQILSNPIPLNGEWEFYWQQILTPEDFAETSLPQLTGYLNIPGYWNGMMVDGKPLIGKGYATVRLLVDNIWPYQVLFLKIPKPNLAYRLYINDVLTSQCGVVGKSEQESKSSICPQPPAFYLTEDRLEIVFHLSNYHHFNGGFWQGLTLGDHNILHSRTNKQIGLDLFLIGALLIMGLYYIGVFSLRRQEKSALYFGLFSLVMSLRTSFHNSIFFMTLFARFDWECFIKMDYLTFPVLMSSFVAYLYYLYPREFHSSILKLFLGIAAFITVFTLFSSTYQITRFLTVYQIITVGACFYTIYIMVLATAKKRNGSAEMLVGCLVFITTIGNDILHAQSIINTTYMMGFGLVLFFISQSYVLTKRFTQALKTSEELSIDLEMKVNDQTAEIRDLLDNTGQGILSFDESLRVQQHSSRATYLIFNQSIYGENILELMFPESKTEIGETFEILFKSGGKMNLVKDLLPDEFERNDKVYDLSFRWIPAGKKSPSQVMMILTDVTIKRKLEKMLKIDEQRNQKIIRIAVDRHGFVRFYNHIQACLKTIDEELEKSTAEMDAVVLSSLYHTLKGGLSGYSFLDVSSIAHQAEDILEKAIRGELELTGKQVAVLQRHTEAIRNGFREELLELGDLVPKQFLSAGNRGFFTIPEAKIDRLEQYLTETPPNIGKLAELVGDLRKQPLRNMMKKTASDANHIAYQLGKQVEVKYSGEDTRIVHGYLEGFFNNIIHLIRNAIHHGIELPLERKAVGKSETGVLSIAISLENGVFTMSFEDDGKGIEVEKLKSKALQKGLVSAEQLQNMSDEEAHRLILLPGFSAKEALTTLSGRGIGMHTVASSVTELGGTVDIKSDQGKGTLFTIAIPVKF